MPQSYSGDLRERVIGTVEAGASRREAADLFEISTSSGIRWVQRWHEDSSSEPKPRGGSRSVEAFAPRPSQGGTFNQGLLGVPASYRALAGSVYVAPLDGSTQGQGLLPKNAGFDAR